MRYNESLVTVTSLANTTRAEAKMKMNMDAKDANIFADLMTATMRLYRQAIDIESMYVWLSALSAYDYPTVRKAFFDHIQESDLTPTPACIIKIIKTGDKK